MEEISWALILLAWCVLFIFSYIFTHYFLFKDYELRGKFAKMVFSLTFSTSCTLLILFLLEMSSFKISSSIWLANFLMFSLLLLYLIPLFLVSKLFKTQYLLYPIFLICYHFLINLNRSLIDHDPSTSIHFSLVEQIRLLGFNGVIFSAFLSGFGAINCTYNYFNFFNEEVLKEPIDEVISKSQKNVNDLVQAKILNIQAQRENQSVFSKLKNIFKDDSGIEQKIKSHEAIHQDYLKKIQQVILNQEKRQLRNSFKGKFYYFLGQILTVYSVYKIFMSIVSFVLKKQYSVDPITRGLQIVCAVFEISPQLIEFITSYVSFGFVGILIFTNVRSFLLLLISMINIVARFISGGLSTQILMAVLSEVTGGYFMASVLLMRANIPEEKRGNLTNALSGIDFHRFHHLFDATFTISALLTAIMLLIKHKTKYKKKIN